MGRLRARQIQITSRVLLATERLPYASRLLVWLGRNNTLAKALVGYRRVFATRQAAEESIRPFSTLGHSDPSSIDLHVSFGKRARPSDYPVLHHLGTLLPGIRRIVDIGGSAGNLLYCYRRYLDFPEDLQWVVHDMPASLQAGRNIALQRGEQRLQFAEDLNRCGPADMVIFSGSLHYFDAMPPALLRSWPSKPEYIVVNRSPMGGSPPVYAVQDAGTWKVTAQIIDRSELLAAMHEGGYELMDEWPAFEFSLRIPLRPDASAPAYAGCMFKLRDGAK